MACRGLAGEMDGRLNLFFSLQNIGKEIIMKKMRVICAYAIEICAL